MTFEFMYGEEWYRYENGWIYKRQGHDFYERFCPVLFDLNSKLAGFNADQLMSTLEAILHGYYHGFSAGMSEKINEFKRIFKLN